METTVQKRIFEALVKAGKVEQPKLEAFLKKGRPGEDANIVKRIAESGLITEKDFLVVMSKELNIPPIDLSKVRIEEQVAKIIPEKIAKQYHMVAVSRIGDNLTLAIFDPTDILALDDVRTVTRCELSIVIATKPDILSALQNSSTARKDGDDGMSTVMDDSLEDSSGVEVVDHGEDMEALDAMEKSKTAPIVKMVAVMITEAIKKRASDIHIEPQEKSLKVRYRVDGELFEAFDLPKKNQNAIIARVKIMSNMDITENRIPQDGRFRVKIEGREIDFRVSVLPTIFGNKVVMRALDKTNLATGLDMLGFLPEPLAVFKTAMSRPYGIILVTGPTGSGKSTTLYSVLNEINVPEKNIVTVEDPVEYQVAGITQLAVQQEIGLDFATGLRSILRQSPDVILIGEIRDHETADIAILCFQLFILMIP
jgi:type IV pilus assembly protein PilB